MNPLRRDCVPHFLVLFVVLTTSRRVSGYAAAGGVAARNARFRSVGLHYWAPSCARRSSDGFNDTEDVSHDDSDDTLPQHANREPRPNSGDPRPYWEETIEDDWQGGSPSHATTFDVLEKDVLEWEKCTTSAGTAWVLLPPPSVATPTAILHFVGGTVTGSAPNVWYRTLLQDLVRHTSCAVLATSIPVTITQSPLDHVRVAANLRRQWLAAYQDILVDEYGSAALQSVPVCGLGHSLGARLLTVLATLGGSRTTADDTRLPPQPYKSFVLMSFTNFGAAAGIPGVAQLFRKSRVVEGRRREPREGSRRRTDDEEDWWEGDDDDDDGYDADWSDLWNELSGVVRAGTARVQSALTPASKSLEFHPTPEQLWKAIREDGRYTVPQTLVVQFDDDEVDQSSLLAAAIVNSSDVKFARLRGSHLTPVSVTDDDDDGDNTINSRVGRLLMKALQGRRKSRPNDVEALIALRQSIARYISDVVTKERRMAT